MTSRRLDLPRFALPERRRAFPLAAALVPVVGAGLLWLVLRTPTVLLFAALGPLMLAAGLLDASWQRRRDLRRETARVLQSLDTAETELEELQLAVRAELARLAPPPAGLASAESRGPAVWADGERPVPVLLGRGTVPSGIETEGGRAAEETPERIAERIRAIRSRARRVPEAPVLLDALGGIAIAGPAVPARALARSIAVQLAAVTDPRTTQLGGPQGEAWIAGLEHAASEEESGTFRFRAPQLELLVSWCAEPEDAPPGTRTVVELAGIDPVAVRVDGVALDAADIAGAHLSLVQARTAATAIGERARRHGLRPAASMLPSRVAASDLAALEAPGPFAIPIGVGPDGPRWVDLVADGPHAVIGGTTGSGKSELLLTWIASLAERLAPDALQLLLVDFKGGATFAPLAGLPHVAGVLSDLDGGLADRAVQSLAAETRRREALLARHGVRAIEQLPAGVLPRLVMVVDEVAALLAEHPGLHALVSDVAARGRSLGMHLILCSQRPAAALREAVLANVAIRACLRVADRADSTALLSTDAAVRLPPEAIGRALLSIRGAAPALVQIASASAHDLERAARRHLGASAPRAPWLPPLPVALPASELARLAAAAPDRGLAFAILDRPESQDRAVARWAADQQGALLVVGGPSSGRSTALRALGAARQDAGGEVLWSPPQPADAWQLWQRELGREAGGRLRLLLVDDADRVLAAFEEEHRVEAASLLATLAQDGRRRGLELAASARTVPSGAGGLAAAFGARLLLGLPSREEHALAGGRAAAWRPGLPPGRGRWGELEAQVVAPDPDRGLEAPAWERIPVPSVDPAGRGIAIVSPRAVELAGELLVRGVRVRVLGEPAAARDPLDPDETAIGDADAWQSAPGLLGEVRRSRSLLLIGCGSAELRLLARTRRTPPPLARGDRREGWLVRAGEVHRVRLAGGDGTAVGEHA
ncbi:FtsK/SpoIIIE domain-containing protein [Homoserinibacter sp. YIM 151385]|uniref:FtsK/SpoIIIE domain-containing protein n=1 Tax=Homoserinibacter sp. YIM 151385 TaxID=2985506 RepID=UPI0022F1424E|nr:FtsK/SpoIIIE domain-containing protein [Homoserinibacter sp. YIM 151385]WBU38313.1 FtsK/SpoIIIE domain-containing protein [Homoserinibacter sp. YIM 151385]